MSDPRLFYRLGELGLVRSVTLKRRSTEVSVGVPSGGHPSGQQLVGAVRTAVGSAGAPPAEVELIPLSEDDEPALVERITELRTATPLLSKTSPTRVLAIGSGKGGVGKSSVTVNLGVALARQGHTVGILDADVYGFSVPAMLGVTEAPAMLGQLLLPPVAYGVRCMSMGFFVPEDQAVIWRGPMLHKALEQFLLEVNWGEPEFLLIDLPPGTGDVSLSIAQFVPGAELFVVTTPQPAAERVAQRAGVLARQLKLPLRGVIENMSWFTGDDGRRYELFGSGGGSQLAAELGVPLLGQVPLVTALREGGDVGRPIAADSAASPASPASADSTSESISELVNCFAELARRVASLRPARVYRSELAVR